MGRRGGSVVVLVAVLAGTGLVGCVGGDGQDRLTSQAEALAEVEAPVGAELTGVASEGCDEVDEPRASAHFAYDSPDPSDWRSFDAALAELSAWYAPRWEELGWDFTGPEHGTASKEVDGRTLWAAIDVGQGEGAGYWIRVSEDGPSGC